MDDWQALADRHGLIRARDARAAGLTARDLARLVSTGQLIHLHHGWYALCPADTSTETRWERRRRLHTAQTYAAVAAQSGQAVASHHSALVLRHLPTFGADLRQVHLTRRSDDRSRKRRGLTVHQQVHGAQAFDEVIATAVAVVQAGCVDGPMAALVAADAALHTGLVTADDLREAGRQVRTSPCFAVRRILTSADGRAESPGETRLRHAVQMMGFTVTPQVAIADGAVVARVDLLLDGAPVVLEFDGFVKYSRAAPFDLSLTPADVVVAEKYREDRLRDLGYEVVRVTWSDLDDLPALRRRIEAAVLRAAGGRRPAPLRSRL